MTDPITQRSHRGPPKAPGTPFSVDPLAMSCILCGHRNKPNDRVHTPRYGRGQSVCRDTDACKARRSKS